MTLRDISWLESRQSLAWDLADRERARRDLIEEARRVRYLRGQVHPDVYRAQIARLHRILAVGRTWGADWRLAASRLSGVKM